MVTSGGGNIGVWVWEWEIQTIGCKTGSRIYCMMWPIFCNNCIWSLTLQMIYMNSGKTWPPKEGDCYPYKI